jgi:hypothetical protein
MRVLHSLAGVCSLVSLSATPSAERHAQRLLRRLHEISEQVATPSARAVLTVVQAASFFMRGRHAEVLEPAGEAVQLCQEGIAESEEAYYLRFAALTLRIGALYALGDFRKMATELSAALSDAYATENRAATLILACNQTLLDELLDRPEQAVVRLRQEREQLPKNGFGTYHALHMGAVCIAAACTGEYDWGGRILEQDWPRFLRSPTRRSANLLVMMYTYRARFLINRHVAEGGSLARLRATVENVPLPPAFAEYRVRTRARLAYLAGDRVGILPNFRKALDLVAGAYKWPDTYLLGRLAGGSEGDALCTEAQQRLLEQGVVNPTKYLRGLFPELFREA